MGSTSIFAEAFVNLRGSVLLLERTTGIVIEANPAFLRTCGRSRDEVLGRNFWAPPFIDDAEAGAEVFDHLRAGGGVEGAQLPLRTGDGTCLLLELTGAPLDACTVELEVRDVTAQAGARVAERMDAQRTLATRVAAEFADMHGALRSAGEMLANCARRGEATFQECDEIRKSADRAGMIVRELQAYSGQLTLEVGHVPLNELIVEMQPALQQLLGRDIEIIPDLGADVSPVMADPAQVRQILLKLAANSGEAMQHRGKFRIATRNTAADDSTLGDAAPAGSYAILEVGDQGPGLDDASWEHLYEPFFTTKPNGKRGLGLAAVHGIVRQMKGRLWAHSEPGRGASFRIYLPAAEQSQRIPPAAPATILFMEQNDGLRTVVTNILRKRGYRVLAASTAPEALEIAKAQGPPDLLISESEPDLLKLLTVQRPHLPALFLNGHSDPGHSDHSDHWGVPTLGKPFELEALLSKVRELLRV